MVECNKNVEVLIKNLDENNISSVLKTYNEIDNVLKNIKELQDNLKIKVKAFMLDKKWKTYKDKETKINVTINNIKEESIDNKQLAIMLTESQLAQVIRVSTHTRMDIVTPEIRKRLKKYVK